MRKEKGITLIALVVTIVVLLILAGVSISMLAGENGVIIQAQKAKEETRAGSVEEARDLWNQNKKLDKNTNSATANTLEELLNSLENDKLITAEERKIIEETGQVTIGSKTIVFKNDVVGLVGNISIEEDGVYIIVNFEENIQDWAMMKAQEATNEEKEKMVMEIITWINKQINPNHNPELEEATTFEEWITILWENQENTATIPKTVDEYLNMIEIGNPENLTNIPIEVKLAIMISEYTVARERGQVIAPNGEITNVCTEGELKYKITQDGKYKFTGISYNGSDVEIQIDANLSNQYYLIPDKYNSKFVLQNAYKEFFEIKPEYEPKIKINDTGEIIDLTQCISYSNFVNKNEEDFYNVSAIDLLKIQDGAMGVFTGEIWLEKDGEIISWSGEFDVEVH